MQTPDNPPERLELRSDILEIAGACARLGGIDLAVGLPSRRADPKAVEGAVRALYGGHNRYADARGAAPLRAALADHLTHAYGLEYDPDRELLVTSGITGGFAACTQALFAAGDELIIFEPFFGWHVRLARLAGLVPRFVALTPGEGRLDIAALKAAVGPRTRGVVVCTPNNPCGTVWQESELEALEEVVLEHDLLVIADEQYAGFCYDDRTHRSPASRPALRPRTLSLGGFSKSLDVTGWRMAYAAAPAHLIDAVRLMHQTLYICAPTPLQHGIAAALPGFDTTDERARLAAQRDQLCDALRTAGFAVHVPEGGFFVMADAAGLTRTTDYPLAMSLLERTGVAAVPGRAFYADGGGSLLRFCFARPAAVLDEACRRLRALPPGALADAGSKPQTTQADIAARIRPITRQDDIDAAAALAYVLYVERMGILGDLADHESRRLYADDMDGATVFGAFVDGELAGCITVMYAADAPPPDFYRDVFALDDFADVAPATGQCIITRLLVAPAHQGSTLVYQLMGAALLDVMGRGVRLIFADTQPHLVGLYARIGLRPYGRPFNYGPSGIGIPLVGALFDRAHLARIGSPMLGFVPPDLHDPDAAARLDAVIGDRRPVTSPRLDAARFDAVLDASIAHLLQPPDAAPGIFYGFGADQIGRILRRGYLLDCAAGIKLIARGQRTRTVYVVLSGHLDVLLDDRTVKLSTGAILGEVAYLTGGERIADVVVKTDETRVLCLGEKAMRALGEGEPALAARFLGNLARILARRMAG